MCIRDSCYCSFCSSGFFLCRRCFFLRSLLFFPKSLFFAILQGVQVNVPQSTNGLPTGMARLFLLAIHCPADTMPQIFLFQKEIFSPTSVFYLELLDHFAVQPGSQGFRAFQCFPGRVVGIPNRIVREYNFRYSNAKSCLLYTSTVIADTEAKMDKAG